jgi:hypothetical protein
LQQYSALLRFDADPANFKKLPAAPAGDEPREMGWAWTNYIKANKTTGDGTSAAGDNAAVPASTTYIPNFLAAAVSVKADDNGKLLATFTLKDQDTAANDDKVVKIERSVKRNYDYNNPLAATVRKFWLDYIRAFVPDADSGPLLLYDSATAEDQDTFTITYEDLAFGVPLRVTTAANPASVFYGWLRLEPEPIVIEERQLRDDTSDATLDYLSTALPADTVFAAPAYTSYNDDALRHIFTSEGEFESLTAFAAAGGMDSGRYALYMPAVTVYNLPVEPKSPVKLNFPIPADFDKERLTLWEGYTDDRDIRFQDVAPTNFQVVGDFVVVTVSDKALLNGDYLLFERAAPDNLATSTPEDGLYRAVAAIKHANRYAPSMGDQVIVNHEGYIEVKDGQKTLYLALRPRPSGDFGDQSLRRVYYYDQGARTEMRYLGFQTVEGGGLSHSNGFGGDYPPEYIFPARVAMPLAADMTAEGYYNISLNIPIMHGESGLADALLLLHSIEKVDGANPLIGYDKTVLRAKLDEAGRLLPTLPEGAQAALTAAIETAQQIYDGNPDSAGIVAARDALAQAMAAAQGAAADKAELNGWLRAGKSVTKGQYSQASWQALQAAIAAGDVLAANPNAEQAALDGCVAALRAAVAGLTIDPELPGESVTTATVTISQETATVAAGQITGAIAAAGGQDAIAGVRLDASGVGDPSEIRITINNAALDALAAAAADLPLSLESTVGRISLDAATVAQMIRLSDGAEGDDNYDLILTVKKVAPSSLTEAQRAAVGDSPVFDLAIQVGDTVFASFDGYVTVDLPYAYDEPAADEAAPLLAVWHLPDAGDPDLVPGGAYLKAAGAIRFVTNHFSLYYITAEWPAADKAVLRARLDEANAKSAEDYAADSYEALRSAISAAQAVWDKERASQAAVDAQAAALATALNNLVPKPAAPAVDTAALTDAIYGAKQLSATAAVYEETSWRALTAAIAGAEAALGVEDLTQSQADSQVTSLAAAIDALAARDELNVRAAGEVALADRTALWNYSTPDQPSMGHAAIDHTRSKLVIDSDGGAELRLFFQALTLGDGALTGYLRSLARISGGDSAIPATVYSTHDVTDTYGSGYPHELGLPVAVGESEVIVEVFVPIMDAIQSGSGTQWARLAIDWSGIDTTGGTAVANVTALTTALEAAVAAGGGGSGYTPASYAALTAALEAGRWLKAYNETLTVTQAMVNTRAAAILAAIAALIPGEGAVPGVATVAVTPTVDQATGKAAATVEAGAVSDAIEAARSAEPDTPVTSVRLAVAVPDNAGAEPIKAVEIALAPAAVEAVATLGADLIIDSALGGVTLPGTALTEIQSQADDSGTGDGGGASGPITVTITGDASEQLLDAQISVIPTGKATFAIQITAGDTPITDLSVNISVSIPYTKAGGDDKRVVVWHVAADGGKTRYNATYGEGRLTFQTTKA